MGVLLMMPLIPTIVILAVTFTMLAMIIGMYVSNFPLISAICIIAAFYSGGGMGYVKGMINGKYHSQVQE